MAHEAQPLVGEQVMVVVTRGGGTRAEMHGRLLLAGSVGVLLANGKGYGLFPWHTIESIIAAEPSTADGSPMGAGPPLAEGGHPPAAKGRSRSCSSPARIASHMATSCGSV